MISDPTIKKSIIASIIASIFVIIFIQPLINFLWNIILFTSKYVYIGYTNMIYENAALGSRNYVIVLIVAILQSFLQIIQ
jgi:hypothetical protein